VSEKVEDAYLHLAECFSTMNDYLRNPKLYRPSDGLLEKLGYSKVKEDFWQRDEQVYALAGERRMPALGEGITEGDLEKIAARSDDPFRLQFGLYFAGGCSMVYTLPWIFFGALQSCEYGCSDGWEKGGEIASFTGMVVGGLVAVGFSLMGLKKLKQYLDADVLKRQGFPVHFSEYRFGEEAVKEIVEEGQSIGFEDAAMNIFPRKQ